MLAREAAERSAAEARAAITTVRVGTDAFVRPASAASVPAANAVTNTEVKAQPHAALPQWLPPAFAPFEGWELGRRSQKAEAAGKREGG